MWIALDIGKYRDQVANACDGMLLELKKNNLF